MFSEGERLIVVMLAELMEAVGADSEIDPALIKTLAINRDDWAIRRRYSGIFASESPSPEVVKETGDILWMWSIIEDSIAELEGEEASEAETWTFNKFGGFDANNDDHYGVALTLIRELGEFVKFRERGLNSHFEGSLPRYRKMFSKFEQHQKAGETFPLSFQALRDIVS